MPLSRDDPGRPKRAPKPRKNWPPVPKGNQRAVTHGVHAVIEPRALEAQVDVIYDTLAASAPVRDATDQLPLADRGVVMLLASTLLRLQAAHAWIDEHGPIDRKGKVRSVALWESKLSRQALGLMSELGLTPKSRFAMGRDLAASVDLAQAMSEPDTEKRQRLLEQAGVIEVTDDD